MNDDLSGMKLFAGKAHLQLARRVAQHLGIALGKMTTSQFADGEIRIMVEESARGNDIFLIQPTCSPANDNVMELMIMLDAFRRASARNITVVMPYYGYARQDKKVKPREPITARLVADMLQMAGATRIVSLDLHAEQIQGFFHIPVDHLYGFPLIGKYFVDKGYHQMDDVAVVSPDVAGVSRASKLAKIIDADLVVINKNRPQPNQSEVVEIVGEYEGKLCIMIDDMIDTGGSIVNGAEALLERGAREVIASCTHPVFSKNAHERLQNSCLSEVVTLDTIPIGQPFEKLTLIPCAALLGDAIRRIHLNESVSELFDSWR